MHGLKTIHQLNKEAAEAREICEKHGVALGDIPAPTGPLPEPLRVYKCDGDLLDCDDCCGSGLEPYDLPNVDESAK
jgi:hypothetical protein